MFVWNEKVVNEAGAYGQIFIYISVIGFSNDLASVTSRNFSGRLKRAEGLASQLRNLAQNNI